jgi:hypothetical protein
MLHSPPTFTVHNFECVSRPDITSPGGQSQKRQVYKLCLPHLRLFAAPPCDVTVNSPKHSTDANDLILRAHIYLSSLPVKATKNSLILNQSSSAHNVDTHRQHQVCCLFAARGSARDLRQGRSESATSNRWRRLHRDSPVWKRGVPSAETCWCGRPWPRVWPHA